MRMWCSLVPKPKTTIPTGYLDWFRETGIQSPVSLNRQTDRMRWDGTDIQ